MEKYRFDDAYGKVYEYDANANAYIHCGSYLSFGITASMSEREKINRVEAELSDESNRY